jgi:hypothetical protein
MEWVVRAGVAAASSLIAGHSEHRAVPDLYGFSVQYAPSKTVDELALAGRFPHPQISYATDDALQAALRVLGYTMRLVASPVTGYHHTFAVLHDAMRAGSLCVA